jgi:hypothetical protein
VFRTFRLFMTLGAAFVFNAQAPAQVFELSGGDSSLYQASGGSLSMHGPSYNASLGAGYIAGHFAYGAKLEKQIGKNLYTAGDDQIQLTLPTDVFDPSHYVYARGLGMKTQRGGFDILAFAGTISTLYETPIFEGGNFAGGMGYLSVQKTISPKWKIISDTLISSKMTQIASAQWTPARKLVFALSGGVGANQPYAAASMNMSRKWADFIGSYVLAGPNFRRVVVTSPIQAETDKGNFLLTLKPIRSFGISGGAQSYVVPNATTGLEEQSSVRDASANLHLLGAVLGGTVYDSSFEGKTNHAAAFTANREFTRWIRVMSNYMVSKTKGSAQSTSLFTTVTETMSPRFSVNQSFSTSNGQTSVLYGGSLLTNLCTISANYETFYVPTRPSDPFQESLLLDVSLHLFGRVNLHGGTFVGPTGKLLYTATANGVTSHESNSNPAYRQPSLGNSIVHILVADIDHRPVEGAALLVDSRPVFTNTDGAVVIHENKPRQHTISVVTDQFLDGGLWEVVSMPHTIQSSTRDDDPGAVIVVRRIPINAANPRTGDTTPRGTGSQ